jgi:hypothetical protein
LAFLGGPTIEAVGSNLNKTLGTNGFSRWSTNLVPRRFQKMEPTALVVGARTWFQEDFKKWNQRL